MKKIYPVILLLVGQSAFSQSQVCPLNSNWSFSNLTHWFAYTGNNGPMATPLPTAIRHYDSTRAAPSGTINVQAIQEYQLPSVTGIQVVICHRRSILLAVSPPFRRSMATNIPIPFCWAPLPLPVLRAAEAQPAGMSGGSACDQCAAGADYRAVYHDLRVCDGAGERDAQFRMSSRCSPRR